MSHRRLPDIGCAVALALVVEGLAVLTPGGVALGLGSGGDTLGGVVLYGGDEEVAAVGEGNELAVRRQRGAACSGADGEFLHRLGHNVLGDRDCHLGGLAAGLLGVDLAVVGVAQRAVVGAAEEADGMCLEARHGGGLRHIGEGCAVHVHRAAVTLADEVHVVALDDGVAVFAGTGREVGVLAGRGVIAPNVACHRRGVVLAPLVLKAFGVLVQEPVLAAEVDASGRSSEHKVRGAALDGDTVELAQDAAGIDGALNGLLDVGGKIDFLAVGAESLGCLARRVVGEAHGFAAGSGDGEDVEIAVEVALESDGAAVGTPYGIGLVAVHGGEAHGLAALYGNGPDVTLVLEGDGAAVRRNLDVTHPQRRQRHGRSRSGDTDAYCKQS